MRCWRLPDGGVLVEVEESRAPAYHHLARSRLVRSYLPRFADDCEILYTYGYRVVGDRFEHSTAAEVGYPYRVSVEPGEKVFDGLLALPAGAVTDAEVNAALGLGPAIEDVYRAFADCPRPERVVGCPHCRPGEADCALLRRVPRLLDAVTLEPFMFSAMTTWGTAEDFRYFAPRILELAVTEQIADLDLEIVLGKLRLAGWPRWPAGQREAVSVLLDRYWTLTLEAYPGPRPAGEVLCALGNAVEDVRPMLRRWTGLAAGSAALHLRDFVGAAVTGARMTGRLPGAFWAGRPAQRDQVVGWLLSADLRNAVEDAFGRAGGAAADALDETHAYLGP